MRHLVRGALVGFGLAVLLLAAFGTGGGLVPLPAPPVDAGADQRIRMITGPPQLPSMIANGLHRPVFLLASGDAGFADASR